MIHTGRTCPTVKAIEFFADGTVKRVEFKTAADYALPLPINPANPSPTPHTFPFLTTWGGCDACRHTGVCGCVRGVNMN